jgi:hypothetical protein
MIAPTGRRRAIAKALTALLPMAPYADMEKIRADAGAVHMKTLPPSIAVWLATIAHVRHAHTDYEKLLEEGYDRDSARFFVLAQTNETLTRHAPAGRRRRRRMSRGQPVHVEPNGTRPIAWDLERTGHRNDGQSRGAIGSTALAEIAKEQSPLSAETNRGPHFADAIAEPGQQPCRRGSAQHDHFGVEQVFNGDERQRKRAGRASQPFILSRLAGLVWMRRLELPQR